jgi:predicted transcriptional regulator
MNMKNSQSKQTSRINKSKNLIDLAKKLIDQNIDLTIKNIKTYAEKYNIKILRNYYFIKKTLDDNNFQIKKIMIKEDFAKRRIEMAKLTREGWNIQKIADKYGISRQAVSFLLKKAANQDNQIVVKSIRKNVHAVDEKNVIRISRFNKIEKKCEVCDKKFVVNSPSEIYRKICSKECKVKKIIEKRAGGKWSRIEKVELKCCCCQKTFFRSNYLYEITKIKKKSNNNYCSRSCYHISRKKIKKVL